MSMAHSIAAPRGELEGSGCARATVIVGLGATGLSCVRHLAARGVAVAVTDSRERPPGLAALGRSGVDATLRLGCIDERLLAAAATVVLSPGVSPSLPAVVAVRDAGVPVIGDIELFARAVDAPVIGITGSNGKSTVTSVCARMAERAGIRARAGGNLSPPALELLTPPGAELYLLELSSFQLETTVSLRTVVAAVLNLEPRPHGPPSGLRRLPRRQGADHCRCRHRGAQSGRPASGGTARPRVLGGVVHPR